jgi:hypothetical protein
MPDKNRDVSASQQVTARLPAGEILTFEACLLSGRAARLLRLYPNLVDEKDHKLLNALAHTPDEIFYLSDWSPENEIERIEQDIGALKLDPDVVDRHALTLLWVEYRESARRILKIFDASALSFSTIAKASPHFASSIVNGLA